MKTIAFGPDDNLLGILHEPEGARRDLVAVTWNTGICGRMGPYRLNVEIAETLAKQGIASFRFDLGNLGDSLRGSTEIDLIERNQAELKMAFDKLESEYGYRGFLLIGICSSAVDAFHAAVRDSRVKGLATVDNFVYPTARFRRLYLAERLFKGRSWKRLATRKYREWTGEMDRIRASEGELDNFEGVWPEQAQSAQDFQSLIQRKMPMLAIYTGGFQHVYSYREQFLDMYPGIDWNGLLDLQHQPKSDHLYTILEDREEFLASLSRWTQERLAPAQESPERRRTLVDVIREIDAYPADSIAVEGQGVSVSYGELSSLSLGLQGYLQRRGLAQATLVGLCLDRSPELIASLLGILRAGHAYLPLDPHYPKDRLQAMIELAQCRLILCHRRHAPIYSALGVETLIWEDIVQEFTGVAGEALPTDAHSTAYVIFTSGSTGTPKGVVLGHGALTELLDWHKARYPAKAPRTLQFTPISFDVSFQEILSTLHLGGTLTLIEEELRLDPLALLDVLEDARIERLFLPFVALQFLAESAVLLGRDALALRDVFTAGEALKTTPALRSFFKSLPQATLHNHYGPSETHVITAYELPRNPDEWAPLPSIGSAIQGSYVVILDSETLKPVQDGEEGELFLGGRSLAEGYIHRPDLTAERFLAHPELAGERLYKTGDRARRLADGNLEFLGRRDGQIKIRGHRIELGEVETQLESYPGIGQIVVDGRTQGDQIYLVAYYRGDVALADLKAHARDRMPEAMCPSYYMKIEDFPRTPSGKIDRKALPSPFTQAAPSPATEAKTSAPAANTDQRAVFRSLWEEILPSADFGDDDNFFDAGGTSLLAMRFVTLLKQRHDIDLRVKDFFARPTISGLARGSSSERARKVMPLASASAPIAIIGMAVDAPGADGLEAFWQLLDEGREGLQRFQDSELAESVSAETRRDPHYVPVRGIVKDPEAFDHEFFQIRKSEAELIDPQQRRLLQLAWQALEDAGLSDRSNGMKGGVFVGTGYNTYLLKQIMQNPKVLERAGDFAVMLANDKDYAATRLAYKLNFKGPALSLHTACSTSLVAIVSAVQSLRRGECEVAIAGAMSIQFPSKTGHVFTEGGILSRDGHCRPYDAEASGTLFSDGGGIVVLKPLDAALRDGDRIYSVIRGAAWNNDGSEKASFSAPSLEGQKEVIRDAIQDSGVPAASISYIEGHGTATPIGDPLEWEALRLAYAEEGVSEGRIALGSVKGNIGHTTASAGVLGLIKTSLAFYRQTLPGTLHFKRLNPEIVPGPFFVSGEKRAWPKLGETKRYAAISSFGVGGTNAHIVLEEGDIEAADQSFDGVGVITLSHPKSEGLQKALAKAEARLKAEAPSASLVRAYNVGRKLFKERTTLVRGADARLHKGPVADGKLRKSIWVFPGQGSQVFGMGRELHSSDSGFREAFDAVSQRILELTGVDLKAEYWNGESRPITQTRISQLGLFASGYALGSSLLKRGAKPDMMLGHSVGEWVAATLAGIFAVDDAIRLLDKRGLLMGSLAEGAMLSVRSGLAEALVFKPADVDLAASNGAMQQVFAGPVAAIEAFAAELANAKIVSRRLDAKHAFHSWMVEPIIGELEAELAKVTLHSPTIPLISSVHGSWLKDAEILNPNYWSTHARVPVQFHKAIRTAAESGDLLLCELGPKAVLSQLARRELSQASRSQTALGEGIGEESKNFGLVLSELWLNGNLPRASLAPESGRARTPGVTYEFLPSRHWVAAESKAETSPTTHSNEPNSTSVETDKKRTDIMRIETIRDDIRKLVEDSSGEVIAAKDDATDFTELGLDSLFLTQFSLDLRNRFKVEISFRQLMENLSSIALVAEHVLDKNPGLYPETAPAAPTSAAAPISVAPQTTVSVPVATPQQAVSLPLAMPLSPVAAPAAGIAGLLQQQLQLMQAQLALLAGQPVALEAAAPIAQAAPVAAPTPQLSATPAPQMSAAPAKAPSKANDEDFDDPAKKVFGAMARISKTNDSLGERQAASLEAFRKAYNEKTRSSKARTQGARSVMADPRVVTGFKPALKEMIYPILVDKSKGAEIWDVDGNRYIDMLNGFGSNFFGYSPEFITTALKQQIEEGYELGPQHPLAIEASELAAELTGFDRVAWCNTGSEAVLGAMRIARTVTGRTRIASFTGSYHGINDEVILRGSRSLKAFAAAPGIMSNAVQNMLVLDYGTEESLCILREQCKDLAAVLIEPAQSRRPDFRPLEFLKEVRKITEENGTVLIFDEVITGFRYHSGGFQTATGIRADIGTYGKVVGGGMPIGMIAGKRRFMDALDGGHWQYGDSSIPEVGVTYFAGTFVRHPLALAAAVATMRKLKELGPDLHKELNRKADKYCADLNAAFKRLDAPYEYANFGSLMKLKVTDESRGYPELLATMLRHKGVHIWDGFPTFVTTAHTDEQLAWVVQQFIDAIVEMKRSGLLGEVKDELYFTDKGVKVAPNHPSARLGVNAEGQAAWFVPDQDRPGKYRELVVE